MPFHQFNNITGRLVESNRFQPLNPINPVPLNKEEPLKMFDAVKVAEKTFSTSSRKMASGASSHGKAASILMKGQECLPENLKKNYVRFQTNIHEPVFLKGGAKDKVLFGITVLGTIIAAADGLWFMWSYRNYK